MKLHATATQSASKMADNPVNDHKFRINQQPKVIPSPHADRVRNLGDGDLIDQIHQAVHKTKNKISNLKQEVVNKDQEVKRERAMRKAAERQEQNKSTEGTYIDPYAGSSPSVSEELRQWLSPAAQRNRLMGRGNIPPKEKERSPPRGRSRHQGDAAEGQEQVTAESYYSSEEDADRRMEERRSRRRGPARKGYNDEEWDDRSSYNRRRHEPPSWYGEYGPPPPPHPAYAAPNPWISPHRVPPIPSYDPRLLHTIGPEYPSYAIHQHATSTPQHPRRHSSGEPKHPFTVPTLVIPTQTKDSGQGDHARSNIDGATLQHSSPQGLSLSSSSPKQIPVTIQIQQSPSSTQQDKSPQPFTSMTESATKGVSQLNLSDKSETVTTGVGTSPLSMHMDRPFDERGLPMLLDELGATKDKNKVLSEKCSEAKLEIESLKMQLGVKDAMSEAEIAAKGAALIEEIYTAQREHDEAIMARLKLANDERDDAFARLQKYHSKDGFDSGTDVNSNEEDNTPTDASLNNLLTRLTVADNRSSINKYGSAIIGRISKTKGRREEITFEEMRAILKEKDIAVAKCKKLEREVIELRRNKESSKYRNNNEKSLMAQLDITRDERDKALVAVKKLKSEIDSLKMYYSLHKSLSQEANLRDQFNNTLGNIEEQVKTRDEVLARTQQNNSQLAQQVRAANDDRNKMVVQIQRFEQENQQLKSKTQQLERLVAVLRKKVAEGAVKTV